MKIVIMSILLTLSALSMSACMGSSPQTEHPSVGDDGYINAG